MKLDSITYTVRQFTWSGPFGYSEASDLRVPPGKIPGDRMFDDACDYGFYVQGDVQKIAFFFSEDLRRGRGEDAEVCGWEYVSECRKFTIHILND
jgi:hypothetical protein